MARRQVSHMDRRQVLKLLGAVAAAGATGGAAGCGSNVPGTTMEQPSGRSITIGLVSPAVGPYRKIGDDITKGFKLYLDDHNQLLGRHRVTLVTADEGASAQTAVAAVSGLLEKSPIALAGLANPQTLGDVATEIDKRKVPLVTTAVAPPTLTNKLFVWRVSQVEGEAGRALAPYARGVGPKSFILREPGATANIEAEEFAAAFADLGGRVVGDTTGATGFGARMQQAVNSGAETIFASVTGANAMAVLQAYRARVSGAKLIGPGSLTETVDLTKMGALPNNVYTSMYYAPDLENEENRRFVSSYHKRNGVQPSTYAMAAYDSASVLDKALRLLGDDLTPAALNRAFSLLGQMESPRGIWAFNINRTPQQKWFLRRLRKDGQVPANLIDADLAVLS